MTDPQHPLARFLALNRTVGVVLVAVLCFGLGEQLWEPFMPIYFKAQSRSLAGSAAQTGVSFQVLWTVGLYAFLKNLLESFCFLGGGHLTGRLGDRRSLLLFACLTLTGYLIFLTVPTSWAALLAAVLILGWEPLSVPVTFTTVGASVDHQRRGMAFAVQSIQKRLPKILGPALAGFVLQRAGSWGNTPEEGRVLGMHVLVAIAFGLGIVSLILQYLWMPERHELPAQTPLREVWQAVPTPLRRLLLAEIFKRWCDWLVRDFVVLYLVVVRGLSLEEAGLLIALQNLVALLTYLPVGRLTEQVGIEPFIGVTFIFFALFPLLLADVPTGWLAAAFVANGLREIGEPARKALITSLMPEAVRARGIGMYWGLRTFAICWSSLVGAWLWAQHGPSALLHAACALGVVGAILFYWLVGTGHQTVETAA